MTHSFPTPRSSALLADEVGRTLHVVRALDLVVDVLDARARGREQRNLVVDLVDAQQGRIADAVADACVADGGPEALVAHGVGGAQANVAEAGDAGVAAAVPATAGQRRAPRQLDPIAGRITESDEATHLALGSFVRGADVHRVRSEEHTSE